MTKIVHSYILESDGAYDMSDEKVMDDMKREIRARLQTVSVPERKIASEFYTAEELVSIIWLFSYQNIIHSHVAFQEQFKKPKKVTKKKLRSRKMLKADDLLAMDSSEPGTSSKTARSTETRRSATASSTSK